MANYKYVCINCGNLDILELPISSDPAKKKQCHKCLQDSMERRIILGNTFSIKKTGTLGQWYKDETGKELLGN